MQDNGVGIAQADHNSIALRGHTSKLDSFDALSTVTTFGFRGEALASLCSLARVAVSTATAEDVPMGYTLTFDNLGKLLTSTREAKTVRLSTSWMISTDKSAARHDRHSLQAVRATTCSTQRVRTQHQEAVQKGQRTRTSLCADQSGRAHLFEQLGKGVRPYKTCEESV